MPAGEFWQVIRTLSNSKAAGVLVYTYKGLVKEQWPLLGKFEVMQNLLQDPRLQSGDGTVELTAGDNGQAAWQTTLPACRSGSSYLFSAEFLRKDRMDGLAWKSCGTLHQQKAVQYPDADLCQYAQHLYNCRNRHPRKPPNPNHLAGLLHRPWLPPNQGNSLNPLRPPGSKGLLWCHPLNGSLSNLDPFT